jgi:ribosomal peptide maturation radical SAM protein 1
MYWRVTSEIADNAHVYVSTMVDELEGYDVVGINTTFFQNIPALALARSVKQRWPEKVVVLGGANCNGQLGITLIEQFDFLDYVFLGEADFSFPEFIARLSEGRDVSDIGGIVRRENGAVVMHPPGQPVNDLDAVPVPDFTDYVQQYQVEGVQSNNHVLLPLESSRGCWWGARHHCTFCGLNADNLTQRQKSFERFRQEVEQVATENGVSYFFMTDNILDWKYLPKFLEWKSETNHGINFFYEIRPLAQRDRVRRLVQAGITMVQPGIEHFSTKILAMMEKLLVGIENIAFLKYAREYGLYPAYNVLCLFPGEDEQEYHRLAENLPKVIHLMPPNGMSPVQYHRFSPYFYRPEKYDIKLRPYRGYYHIYPFETEVLQNLCYIFDLVEPLKVPQGSDHLLGTNRVINAWKDGFSEEVCTLTWEVNGEDIVIKDHRPGFSRRMYRLVDGARSAFFALDSPATLNSAIRRMQQFDQSSPWLRFQQEFDEGVPGKESGDSETAEFLLELRYSGGLGDSEDEVIISFSEEDFFQDPLLSVKPLVDSGLVYEEEGRFLALPVYKRRLKTDETWKEFDV